MFERLSLLNEIKVTWNFRVRVSRMWFSTSYNGIFQGCNLILLDKENYAVHGFIEPEKWKHLADVVTEGKVYDITNFNTRIATGTLRLVLSSYCIDFTNESIIIPVLQDDFTLPFHKFEFTDLANLTDIVNSYPETKCPEYSIDLIGVVQDLQEPTLVPTIYGEMQLVRFQLTDGRHKFELVELRHLYDHPHCIVDGTPDHAIDIAGTIRDIERVGFIQTHVGQKNFVRFVLFDGSVSVKVTVWDENIVVLNQILENNFEEIPIVVLATMRARLFLGSVQVSTTSNSRIYINITYDPILHIRQRLIDQGYVAPVNPT
ncbi:hypothetical protein POM88_053482 [Heracleum sosnowskyi]|uniref:Replication protein A 70 kDa DNA-binding subunit B/D first OB fold domain-containing protein n=1 Tax=Heracleum sosnowskyi TaxID=360622 RepID=A0AAD8LXN9_9APIA|nr:hypothetical protein POM88_053482 [Heracleum sosnowskyi]